MILPALIIFVTRLEPSWIQLINVESKSAENKNIEDKYIENKNVER